MNVRMWQHQATQRNLQTLTADGIATVGPNEGDMACGEFGPGRMAEPDEILAAISIFFVKPGALAGRRVLITAGPTHEPIDPVRYIANRSSGKQGYALAAAAAALGAETVLVSGPTAEPVPSGVTLQPVETAQEMLDACLAALPADIGIFAAAVADWRVRNTAGSKLKKDGSKTPPPLDLDENPDILKTVANLAAERPALVVGFRGGDRRCHRQCRGQAQAQGLRLDRRQRRLPRGRRHGRRRQHGPYRVRRRRRKLAQA